MLDLRSQKNYKNHMTRAGSPEITVIGSRIVRPGFYRDATVGSEYAQSVRRQTAADCVFCPKAIEERDERILEEIGTRACTWLVMFATPAYDHFDAQQVIEHRLIVPDVHVECERELGAKALAVRDEWIASQTPSSDANSIQPYTRAANNPSKSQPHLHTHVFELSPNPVSRCVYDASEGGVTELEFFELTLDQRAAIAASRTDRSNRI